MAFALSPEGHIAPRRCGQMGPLFANFVNVHVAFRPRRQSDRDVALPAGATVADLLRLTGDHRDHTLVLRGATPIAEDEVLQDGDTVTLLSAFSGG